MKEIKETVKHGGQFIVKYEDKSIFLASKIVAGLAWPTEEKDGYFCVLGDSIREKIVPEVEARPVEVLVEEEHALLPALFSGLAEQVKKTNCTTIYAQFNPAVVNKVGFDGTNKSFVLAFNDFKKKRYSLALLSLQPALITDWLVGCLTVRKWQKERAIKISHDSIMYGQLKGMVTNDRKRTEQDRFPAMTALICAMTPFINVNVSYGLGLRAVIQAKYAW